MYISDCCIEKLSLDFRSNLITELHTDKVDDRRFSVRIGVSECIGYNLQRVEGLPLLEVDFFGQGLRPHLGSCLSST